jgi:uncharacterized OB-fold protein
MDETSFGIVSITRETKALDFVKHLENGMVMGTRCRACMGAYFPPRMDCPKCRTSDVEWVRVEAKGRLVTYTTVHYGPSGFEQDTPYTLALLDVGNGMKVLGRVNKRLDEKLIAVGMELNIVPVRLPGDRITYEFSTDVGQGR